MRIVVVGTSGSGKTTLARTLSQDLGLTHIELDAINWQPGWHGLNEHDPDELMRRADAATVGDHWVVDGGYAQLRSLLWKRASHLVWLDYERGVIMRRVIWRSLLRIVDRKPLWNGNRERWWWLLRADHPIRWAWDTWAKRRAQFSQMVEEPDFAHLRVFRLRAPHEAEALAGRLRTG